MDIFLMWDEIDNVRNQIAGYQEQLVIKLGYNQREASRKAMLRLYARRRKAGLNSRGLPYKVKSRSNHRYGT